MSAGVVLDTSYLITLAEFRTIKLEDGFDPAFFNGGQRELGLGEENDSEE